MLSRKCCFTKATSRTEYVALCEDCLVAVLGCERKDHGDECARYSTHVLHLDVLLWYSDNPSIVTLKSSRNQTFQDTKSRHLCLSSFVDRMTPGYHSTPWSCSPKSCLFLDALVNSLESILRGNVWTMNTISFSPRLFSSELLRSYGMGNGAKEKQWCFYLTARTDRWTVCGGKKSLTWWQHLNQCCTTATETGTRYTAEQFCYKPHKK